MEIERDFKELLELLNSHEVEYIIVGGFALALHGAPRFTGDLDVFLKADPENAKRVVAALSIWLRFRRIVRRRFHRAQSGYSTRCASSACRLDYVHFGSSMGSRME